jgi:hypothetical protein
MFAGIQIARSLDFAKVFVWLCVVSRLCTFVSSIWMCGRNCFFGRENCDFLRSFSFLPTLQFLIICEARSITVHDRRRFSPTFLLNSSPRLHWRVNPQSLARSERSCQDTQSIIPGKPMTDLSYSIGVLWSIWLPSPIVHSIVVGELGGKKVRTAVEKSRSNGSRPRGMKLSRKHLGNALSRGEFSCRMILFDAIYTHYDKYLDWISFQTTDTDFVNTSKTSTFLNTWPMWPILRVYLGEIENLSERSSPQYHSWMLSSFHGWLIVMKLHTLKGIPERFEKFVQSERSCFVKYLSLWKEWGLCDMWCGKCCSGGKRELQNRQEWWWIRLTDSTGNRLKIVKSQSSPRIRLSSDFSSQVEFI